MLLTEQILLFRKIALSLQRQRKTSMKYSELERKLSRIGCYYTGKDMNGHPLWYSPVTKKCFKMSHHRSEEVASATLKSIKASSGLE
jgi:hypothetical protein